MFNPLDLANGELNKEKSNSTHDGFGSDAKDFEAWKSIPHWTKETEEDD